MTTGREPERRDDDGWMLASLAAVTLALARAETTSSPALLAATTVIAIAWPRVARYAARRNPTWGEFWNRLQPGVALAVPLLTFAGDGVLRLFALGDAVEIVMLAALQNTALALTAFERSPRTRPVTPLLSAFLVLFAIVISSDLRVWSCAGLFGVATLWWLMAGYWERLQRAHLTASSQSRLPLRFTWIAISLGLVLLAVVATWGASRRGTYALRGFLPTSGGDRWSDPAARAGVGDGDALVAAEEDAQSFGPVESDLFLESKMPSLYDVASEIYGRPPKPNEQRNKTIALGSGKIKHPKGRTARHQRSGREFSTVRRLERPPGKKLEDRDAPALLYVIGRSPQHLAVETFDTFDGDEWSQTEDLSVGNPPTLRHEGMPAKPWLYLQQPGSSPLHRAMKPWSVKVINLKTTRVPSPPQLVAIHVDRVDRTDFFGRTRDGCWEMTGREQIPQLTVFHLRAMEVDLTSLRHTDFTKRLPGDDQLPDRHLARDFPRAAELAREWTAGVPRGWEQVEAIVSRLRSEFVHDTTTTPPADGESSVEHFLAQRRGPDYQFAPTAAVMLRHLGYATRLVSGFYVRPDRYDRRAGQTTVLPEDLHTWLEVRVDHRHWVPVEPTPGYSPPHESRPWISALAAYARSTWRDLRQQPLACLGFAIAGLAVIVFRRTLLDSLATSICVVAGTMSASQRIRWTLKLLEFRGRVWGERRPTTMPVSRWYLEKTSQLAPEAAAEFREFVRIVERLLYGVELSSSHATVSRRRIDQVCFSAIRHSTAIRRGLDHRCGAVRMDGGWGGEG